MARFKVRSHAKGVRVVVPNLNRKLLNFRNQFKKVEAFLNQTTNSNRIAKKKINYSYHQNQKIKK